MKKPKKTRRSLYKKPKEITVYYCNINGFQTKKESIRKIVDKLQPKIVIMCETKLPSGSAVKKILPEFEVCAKPTKAGKSGLVICVKLQTFQSILDVTTTPHINILAVRITMAEFAVRIILGYAPQENDKAEEREEFFTEMDVEITNSMMAGELPLVIGDMNSKINKDGDQIKYSSSNGKFLMEMVENHELEILNFNPKCFGKWTHVVRTSGASSVLDYATTCSKLVECTSSITIDEECLLCPFGVKKRKGVAEPQFSDHNAIILKMSIPHEKKKIPIPKKWKLTQDGLEKFRQITTDEFNDRLPTGNVQEVYDQVEERINAVMNQCFKKTKVKKTEELRKNYMDKYKRITKFARKGKAQRKVAKLYIQQIIEMNTLEVAAANRHRVQTTLENLTVDNKFSPNNFWELCKKNRKNASNITSIETAEGTELYGDEVISDAYLNEFVHRLRKREIIPELKRYEERTEQVCQLYINEARNKKEPPYTKDEYLRVQKNLKKGKSCGRDLLPPEIFINGGNQLHTLLLALFNLLKSADYTVHQWTLVLIATIYKNKGKRKQLVNHRGIFLKQILSKMYEKLNMNRIDHCVKKIDKFQAGNKTDRSTADQTFLIRAASDHCKYINKPLFLVLYDYTQCFDSLWLSDCLLALRNIGVESETLNNLKNLNRTCNLKVKSPVGITNQGTVESIVQQGSVSGGVLCSASTAEVTKEDLGKGCQIGLANIKAVTFVDDITSTNTDTQSTYTSHQSIVWFSKKKRIPLNIPKCMIMGINIRPSDIVPRLKIEGKDIKEVNRVVCLGDQFNSTGTNKDLIEDRAKKGRACTISAMSMCSEVTMGNYSIQTLLLLYRSLFVPVVLYNSQAWSNLTKQNIMSLKTTQMKYLKRIFHTPPSTSNAITLLETGILPIEQEINKRQLNFLHHILSQEEDDPVKLVYREQLKFVGERNWANEVAGLRMMYEISEDDSQIPEYSKDKWKFIVKTKITSYALKRLNEDMSNQKHGSQLGERNQLKPLPYLEALKPHQARTVFQIRAGVLDVKALRKYWYDDSVCRLCQHEEENVNHVVNECTAIPRPNVIQNILQTEELSELEEIANRCIVFAAKVKELETAGNK